MEFKKAVEELIEAVEQLPVQDWVEIDGRGEPELIGYLMQAQGEWDRVRRAVEKARSALMEESEDGN